MLYEELKSVRDYFPINLCPIQDDALTSQEQDEGHRGRGQKAVGCDMACNP